MIIKFFIYIATLALIFFLYSKNILSKEYNILTTAITFLMPGILLIMEIDALYNRDQSLEKIKRKVFKFSFAIGIIWGILMSFSAGYHYWPNSIIYWVWWIINILLMGFVVGILGKYMSGYIIKRKKDIEIDDQ